MADRLLLRVGEGSPRRNGSVASPVSSCGRNPSGSHPGTGGGDVVQPRTSSSKEMNRCDVTDSSVIAAAAAAAGRQCQSPVVDNGGEPVELRYAYKQYKRLRKNSAPRSFRPGSSSSFLVLGRGDDGVGGGGGGPLGAVASPRGHDPEEWGRRPVVKEEGRRSEDYSKIDVAVQCDIIVDPHRSCRTGHQWEEEGEENEEEEEEETEDGVGVRLPCQASMCRRRRCRRKRTFPAETPELTAPDADCLLPPRRRRRCSPCGITFDDDVIFSIHMGCHSHAHPFICNVCGRQCENKYAFNTHVLRGHHPT